MTSKKRESVKKSLFQKILAYTNQIVVPFLYVINYWSNLYQITDFKKKIFVKIVFESISPRGNCEIASFK